MRLGEWYVPEPARVTLAERTQRRTACSSCALFTLELNRPGF